MWFQFFYIVFSFYIASPHLFLSLFVLIYSSLVYLSMLQVILYMGEKGMGRGVFSGLVVVVFIFIVGAIVSDLMDRCI